MLRLLAASFGRTTETRPLPNPERAFSFILFYMNTHSCYVCFKTYIPRFSADWNKTYCSKSCCTRALCGGIPPTARPDSLRQIPEVAEPVAAEIFCSDSGQLNVRSRVGTINRLTHRLGYCTICGTRLRPAKNAPLHRKRYCSAECRTESLRIARLPKEPVAEGYYVYAFFEEGSNVPCYIGEGFGSRAWRDDNAPNVAILQDGLTKEGARAVEAAVIRILTAMGVKLRNVAPPMKRSPIGPITYES